MPSYNQYKRQIAVLDADDNDIESWITVRGNHIPIKKGQSKEEAVKSFIEGKKKNLVENHNSLIEATKLEKQGYFGKETPSHSKAITKSAIEMGKEEKNLEELMEFGVKEANNAKAESKYDPEFEVVRKNALANGNVYGGKYTQKSKAEAYKEYKNDTSSKENMKKANEFVNGKPESSKKWSGWGMNKNKQVFSIKGGRVVVDPKLKTANWYNSQGALTLKQKDLDVDKFVEHGVNNLGWQKMSGKEESMLKEFQKIANKPEYKGKEKPEAGFEPFPKDYTIAHKDKNGKTTVIAEVSHKDISENNTNKTKSDSALVNAVAKSLGKTPEEAEKEINGAVQYIKDLIKSKDLRNGDVEETLQGLGVEPDYAEEFMQWVSHPTKKKSAPKVTHVDKKAWNSPATDPWKSLYDSADTKKRWSADWKKK